MTRRRSIRWVLAIAATAMTLASCATFSSDAARVGDARLSGEAFRQLLADTAATPGFEGFTTGDSVVNADFARDLLLRWITGAVLVEDLAARGLSVSAELRQTVADELAVANGALWQEAPAELRNLFTDSTAAFRAFSEAAAPDPETLRATYDQGILVSRVACTRHILTATEDEALEALAELRAGATFADVAAQWSLDTGSATNGGVIGPDPNSACFDIAIFAQSLVTEYVETALAAVVGEPAEPVQSSFGWHVIEVRPFDEVAQEVARVASAETLQTTVSTLISEADIHVASKYGRFDPERGAVVPLGG